MFGSSSVSPLSSAWVENLVRQTMVFERQPLTRLEQQRDSLKIRQGIYSDITSKLDAVKTSLNALKGVSSAFNSKAVSVAETNDTKITAVALNGKPVASEYKLKITQLAQAHQVGSAKQAQSNIALNLSGSFIVGGAASSSATKVNGLSNPVTSFDTTADIRDGERELGTGTYSVEFRQNEGDWQFRVVDQNGDAVRINDASEEDTALTANWQNFDQVQGETFDTGRGLTIAFDSSTPVQQLYGDSNIASVDYTAKGVTIDVEATDSLNDIRDKIRSPENSQKYAEGNEIQATVVDRRLVLTSSQTGTSGKIKLFEVPEGVEGVLHELGIDVDGSGSLADPSVNELRAALDAGFSINNVDITRSRNKGLTDIVQGLSFDLTGTGETTVTVSDDNDAVADKTNDFLKAINDLRTYLKAKTEAVQGKDNESGNPTYTSAPLGQDYSIRLLRQDIGSLMLGGYDAAIGDAPKYLAEVGITLNTSGAFELSDNEKFSLALKNDFQGVQDLFADILGELENRLDMYNDGSKAILKSKQNALDDELKQVNSHIESTTKVLSRREDALRTQYMSVQSQLISMTYQFQSMQAISAGSMYSGQY